MAINQNQYVPLPPPQDTNGIPLYLNNELLNLSRFLNNFQEEAGGGLFPGDNISELVNNEGYISDITGESLKDLSDVSTSMSPTNGQVLMFNGSVWQSSTLAGDEDWGLITESPTSFDDYGSIV